MRIINIQHTLRPELPNIYCNIDYKNFRAALIKIDEILRKGRLEDKLIEAAIDKWNTLAKEDGKDSSDFINTKTYPKIWKQFQFALRCNIGRILTGKSFRKFSVHLSDSVLFQWFTDIHYFTGRKSISKSSLERFSKMFDDDVIAKALCKWQSAFLTDEKQTAAIGLEAPISFSDAFLDGTCVKANIHFPVDWVLLRDAVRSLLLAIKAIRAKGLKHRITSPAKLLKLINNLSIEMTHTRRKKDSKRQRKNILRKMKKLNKVIAKHGERYRELLLNNWHETDWTEIQAQQVIARIDNILSQLPAAIKQAHDRIIGERKISSKEKILSLYEPDIHVIVRGKAGAEVEFGNGLLIAEQKDGIIVDWELFKDQPKSDSKILQPLINRIQAFYGVIDSATGDRGFDSKDNRDFLKEHDIYNGLCPKSPKQLQERIKESRFLDLQGRRSQTEGRIGIFKNVFLGKPLKSKGFLNKQLNVAWCVLTHNLWVIARMALADEAEREKEKNKKAKKAA